MTSLASRYSPLRVQLLQGGNLDALVHTGESIVSIRAIGGHTCKAVDPALMNRVKVTHKTFPRLYHVTSWNRINSIYDKGLRPGGLDRDGKKESFFSCQSQAAGEDPEAQKKVRDYYATCDNSYYAGNTNGEYQRKPHKSYQLL